MSNSEIDNLLKNKTITSLSTSLPKNIKTIKNSIGNSNDIIIREFLIGKPIEVPIAIIYTDGLADNTSITDFILESIISDFEVTSDTTSQEIVDRLKTYCLTVGSIKNVSDFPSLFNAILSGETVLLLEGLAIGISTSTKSSKDRSITEL